MEWRWWSPTRAVPALTASAAPTVVAYQLPANDTLTAAASAVRSGRESIAVRTESWQNELWEYYDGNGEFRYAVDWRANAMSRVRLRAGRMRPGRDEPEILDTGPAAELVAELGGGIGGQSALLSALATLLDVPGEAYVVGEDIGDVTLWQVRSADEIRTRGSRRIGTRGRAQTVEIIDDELSSREGSPRWRPLEGDYMTVRIWRPHRRYAYMADSRARSARSTLRELDLINRKITAQYLSRLASAGLVVFPSEIDFPVREEFADDANPFVREWIETAREAIATPGTAAAVVPIPIKVPGEYVDKVKFIDFTTLADTQEIVKRESAIKRLATQVDIPAEILLGMGTTNHWSSWQLEESAIKIHIAPTAELITHALTLGYLVPRLEARGEDVTDLVMWYDTSELTLRPDRSTNAVQVYDRFELSGKALRRETGFDEDDEPSDDELATQILKQLARNPQMAVAALEELTGTAIAVTGTGGAIVAQAPVGQPKADGGPPDTQEVEPPAPEVAARAALGRSLLTLVGRNANFREALVDDSITEHLVNIGVDSWHIRHPTTCGSPATCLYTISAYVHPGFSPGTPGTYRCSLDDRNRFVLGARRMNVG